MLFYLLMFLIPAAVVVTSRSRAQSRSRTLWWVAGVLLVLLIGLRHEVGADWFNYLRHFDRSGRMDFIDALTFTDPGHYVLNWLVARAGGDIYVINLFYSVILVVGTIIFCRQQPRSWLALAIAVPYLLVVVGMGYSRQAVALGFALIGLAALGNKRVLAFVFWIAVGAFFHKSAVLLLPIAALSSSRNRFLTGFLVGVVGLALYYLLVADVTEQLWTNYVERERESQGAVIRVLMNVVPAVLFFGLRNKLGFSQQERRLWGWMALFAIVCLLLVPFASTAVDRVALYLIPLQIVVFSRIPLLAGGRIEVRTPLVLAVLVYYALVLLVWLKFASHSMYWLPYNNLLLVWLSGPEIF